MAQCRNCNATYDYGLFSSYCCGGCRLQYELLEQQAFEHRSSSSPSRSSANHDEHVVIAFCIALVAVVFFILLFTVITIIQIPLIWLLMGSFDAKFFEWVDAARFDRFAWLGSLLLWSDGCLIFFLIQRQMQQRPIVSFVIAIVIISGLATYVLPAKALPSLHAAILEERLKDVSDKEKPPTRSKDHMNPVNLSPLKSDTAQ